MLGTPTLRFLTRRHRDGSTGKGAYGVPAKSTAMVRDLTEAEQPSEQRARACCVSMALDAERVGVLKLIVGQGLRLASVGAGIGLVVSLALARFSCSLPFGAKPTDPVTFVAVLLVLTAVALLASYIPVRRAAKVDPMVALRYE